ncbi:ribbon-helix-helix domain-containing protein [Novosphingobium sp. P6W]|uniref:ribbon-helix-helix domain-containing protein n=1 Tax=Novosphingobium sp. P6W TaxID=1609758 RepID=UPI000A62E431|nr:ribbon-helix-helix domain-containing protein [Novosphingobium sp. P6W]
MSNSTVKMAVSVRLTSEELRLLDQVAKVRGYSRSDALRDAVRVAGPMIISGTGVNVSRALMSLEILVAECIDRVTDRDPGDVQRLVDAASRNVSEYHA